MKRVVLIAAAVALGGCAGSRPAPVPLVPDAPAVDLATYAGALDKRLAAIGPLRAGLEMRWDDPLFPEAEDCRGSLSYESPGRLRLRGITAAFFTVFDFVVDDDRVFLDVPREGVTVFGFRHDAAWASLPLSPHWVLVGLVAHPGPGRDCWDGATATAPDSATVILRGEFGELHLDRETGLPRELRGPDGVRVEWSGWADRDGVAWPEVVRLVRPEGRRWTATWGRVTLDRSIPPSRFAWDQDEMREILSPADASRRWNRYYHPE